MFHHLPQINIIEIFHHQANNYQNTTTDNQHGKRITYYFSARSSSPLPLAIEQSGAPPIPNKLVTAVTNIIIGKVIP